jgi:hypothetical protein
MAPSTIFGCPSRVSGCVFTLGITAPYGSFPKRPVFLTAMAAFNLAGRRSVVLTVTYFPTCEIDNLSSSSKRWAIISPNVDPNPATLQMEHEGSVLLLGKRTRSSPAFPSNFGSVTVAKLFYNVDKTDPPTVYSFLRVFALFRMIEEAAALCLGSLTTRIVVQIPPFLLSSFSLLAPKATLVILASKSHPQ